MVEGRRVCLAVVTGAHGVRGEVKLRPFTAEPEAVGAYGPLSDAAGRRRFTVEAVRATPKGVVARFAGIADRTAAEALRGTELWVDRTALPEPDPDEWYVEDLIGLDVVDAQGVPLGTVRAIADHGAGDVVEIVAADGRELVLPFTRACFPVVDPGSGRLQVGAYEVLEAAP